MIRFFKEPLIKNCTCKGCCNSFFTAFRMPRQVYDSFMEFLMPMPIPKHVGVFDKESDATYMTFKDARKLSFTNKHQPPLVATPLRITSRKRLLPPRICPPQGRLPLRSSRSSRTSPILSMVSLRNVDAWWSVKHATSLVAFFPTMPCPT